MGFDSEDEISDTETDVERATAVRTKILICFQVTSNFQPAPVLDSPDHLPIFEDQLLDGLQNWMDRLFEGSTYRSVWSVLCVHLISTYISTRYHVNYWPEFPISPSTWNSK